MIEICFWIFCVEAYWKNNNLFSYGSAPSLDKHKKLFQASFVKGGLNYVVCIVNKVFLVKTKCNNGIIT